MEFIAAAVRPSCCFKGRSLPEYKQPGDSFVLIRAKSKVTHLVEAGISDAVSLSSAVCVADGPQEKTPIVAIEPQDIDLRPVHNVKPAEQEAPLN